MMKRVMCVSMLLLSGCSLAPELTLPDILTPSAWHNEPKTIAETKLDVSWWEQFGSEELTQLIAKAEGENLDLAAAMARIEQARATTRIAGAPLLPEVGASADVDRNFNHRGANATRSGYSAGIDIAYELDLFGRNWSESESADWLAKASEYDYAALKIAIAADTAKAYFSLLSLTQRMVFADSNLANARLVLRVTKIRQESGALSALELAQQENFVGSSEAAYASLTQQREAARNALAILIGVSPETFETTTVTSLAVLTPPDVPVAMPSEWLARRPDIARSEAELTSANFDIGAARAAFFPSLTLSAGTAIAAAPISASATALSTLASGLSVPLFTGGALEGGLERATARQKELAASYRKTVITAYGEAENALMGVSVQTYREESLKNAAAAAQTAYDAAMVRFDNGATDTITLLDAQRSLLQAEDTLATARADRLSASVDLFRAMGGGWQRPSEQ